jgi:hypothetical protein
MENAKQRREKIMQVHALPFSYTHEMNFSMLKIKHAPSRHGTAREEIERNSPNLEVSTAT